MWTDMGDYLSRQYAGTDSTISSVSRDGKETFEGKMGHKAVAVKRFFLNTFSENPMQLSIDIVLGKFLNQGYSK
jgi:synaptojanin